MDYNEVWTHKDNNCDMKILRRNQDGSIEITFDFGLNPRRTYQYQKSYIEEHYKSAGYKSTWSVSDKLTQFGSEGQTADVNKEAGATA